jgi:glycosyltransferase involved in cell wall biosynthesis
MIRVLHVTEDHSARAYGISSAVDALTRCTPASIRPAIACVGTETIPLREGMELHAYPTRGIGRVWRYAPGASRALAEAIRESDVVHVHGLWMWIQWEAARQAARQGKPFVVTPHGMLEPWIWDRQRWPHRLKKYLYWNELAYPAFCRASAVHALTAREAATLAGYFPGQTPLVLPHGLDLRAIDAALAGLPPREEEPPYFLFLGRLHPVKAIHLLVRAFARLPGADFRLKIAGPVQPQEQAYAASLRQLAAGLGLEGKVVFTGPIEGAAKWRLYRDAWAFCLTSFSVGLSVVDLEAAACRTPVITTRESGVVEEWAECGGVFVRAEEESILAGLRQALGWSAAERQAQGQALRGLVERRYSWEKVGEEWAAVYERLMGAGTHG